MWDGNLRWIKAVEHRIELVQLKDRPIHSVSFRQYLRRARWRQEIDRMLAMYITERSQTEYLSPIVFVLKKDGTLCFCVEYQKLNAVTMRDSYQISRKDERTDSLS